MRFLAWSRYAKPQVTDMGVQVPLGHMLTYMLIPIHVVGPAPCPHPINDHNLISTCQERSLAPCRFRAARYRNSGLGEYAQIEYSRLSGPDETLWILHHIFQFWRCHGAGFCLVPGNGRDRLCLVVHESCRALWALRRPAAATLGVVCLRTVWGPGRRCGSAWRAGLPLRAPCSM